MKPPVPVKTPRTVEAVVFGYNSCDMLCLLDEYPAPDTKLPMRSFARQGGGQAATAAVTLARLGLHTRYLGKFGDTPEGDFARQSLLDAGVELTGSLRAEKTQNQLAVIWVDQSAHSRTIAYLREPGLDIQPGEIAREAIDGAGLLLLDGHDLPASVELARRARAAGLPVLLDVGKLQPGLGDLLELTDYALCDARFPQAYTGVADAPTALEMIRDQHRTPVVGLTMGERGALLLVGRRWLRQPAYAVPTVDTTGAGDVWHGAFAAGLLWGLELEEILRVAAGAAALKCRRLGGRQGIPEREELFSFLKTAAPLPTGD